MPFEPLALLFERMYQAGLRLIAAQKEEEHLAVLLSKSPNNEDIHNQWATARRVVEECQAAYNETLRRSGLREKGSGSP